MQRLAVIAAIFMLAPAIAQADGFSTGEVLWEPQGKPVVRIVEILERVDLDEEALMEEIATEFDGTVPTRFLSNDNYCGINGFTCGDNYDRPGVPPEPAPVPLPAAGLLMLLGLGGLAALKKKRK